MNEILWIYGIVRMSYHNIMHIGKVQFCYVLHLILYPHYTVYAVNFDDLYNLRAPVGNVEGFNITAFDRAVSHTRFLPLNVLVAKFSSALH